MSVSVMYFAKLCKKFDTNRWIIKTRCGRVPRRRWALLRCHVQIHRTKRQSLFPAQSAYRRRWSAWLLVVSANILWNTRPLLCRRSSGSISAQPVQVVVLLFIAKKRRRRRTPLQALNTEEKRRCQIISLHKPKDIFGDNVPTVQNHLFFRHI